MRFTLFAGLGISAMLLAGCDDDGDAIVAPNRPRASVRFINAVPDTVVTDWRFIDRLENTPYEVGFAFRAQTDYQGIAPGARPLRIFPGTNDTSTKNFLIEQTIDFVANRNYTLIHTGFSRPGSTPADQLLVVEEEIPTVAENAISVRTRHLGAGLGAIDVYLSSAGGDTIIAATATPTFTNLAYGNVTPYVSMAPRPKTGPIQMGAASTGYSRPEGSFAADGFLVGDQITVAGFGTGANDGRSIVTAIVDQKTTGPITLAADSAGFTRTTGSFITDGFVANTWITVTGFGQSANNGRFLITAATATRLTVATPSRTIAEAAGSGRTIVADARMTVRKTTPTATASVGTRTVVGELVFRATATGTKGPILAEWTAPPGELANPALNLQALGGATMGGSAIMAMFVPRSVLGSRAPQAGQQNNPPTPSFLGPAFIFAIDKHPR